MSPAHDHSAGRVPWLAVTAAGVAIALVLVWLAGVTGLWGGALVWIQSMQRHFFDELGSAVAAVREQGALAAFSLIAISFFYGVFHAAGPGHGKAVVATFLLTQKNDLRRGLALSTLAAFFQGVTAVVAVQVTVMLLDIPLREARSTAMEVEAVSYALILLIGVFLAFSAIRRLRGHAHHHHGPEIAEQPTSWWKLVALAFSIGLRPCSGAILVLLLAHTFEMAWAGIVAVFAMSAGTAGAVGILAYVTVHLRTLALRFARARGDDHHHHGARWLDLVALTGGVLIALLGASLLQVAMKAAPQPIF